MGVAKKLRVVFAGTPDFAKQCLASLVDGPFEIVWVYARPDARTGRGQKYLPPPVKVYAQEKNIPCYQPAKLQSAQAKDLKEAQIDVMVVAAYGQIIPESVLSAPKYGCINVHASLLPRWRGAAPIQRAILAGDKTHGITIMQMDAGMDTGPILCKVTADIKPELTAGMLTHALADLGAKTLPDVLLNLSDYPPVAQPKNGVSYAPKIAKQEALLVWTDAAWSVYRQTLAFNPWPMAFTYYNGVRVRIITASVFTKSFVRTGPVSPGMIVMMCPEGLVVACGDGFLCISQLQFAGKKVQAVAHPQGQQDFVEGSSFQSN